MSHKKLHLCANRSASRRKGAKRKKNTKTKKKRNIPRRKKRNPVGGTILAQGTHGTITIDPLDPNTVIKTFMIAANCTKLQNEYNIQTELSNDFKESNIGIIVPTSCCYSTTGDTCKYKMTRIYPFPEHSYYLILNLAQNEIDKKFSHSSVGYEVGINAMANKYGIDVQEYVFEIGKMFSYLHYVKQMDGYDCEIIVGSLPENQQTPQMFLIDFDKIQKFEFRLGVTVYRKLDERTIDEKILSSTTKFAWFLFGALISMSLVPTNPEFKQIFIDGYKTYSPVEASLQKEVFETILQIIADYDV